MDSEENRRPSWAAIEGRWAFSGRSATYTGSADSTVGIALAPGALRSGRISARVLLGDTSNCVGRVLVGYDAQSERHYSVGLGGDGFAYTVGAFEPDQRRYESIAGKGSASQLESDRWYDIEIQLRGRNVSLAVDGILVISQTLPYSPSGAQTGLFASGSGAVEFDGFAVDGSLPKAFVVMRFEETYDNLYREVIRPVCEKSGFDVHRADDVFRPGIILQDIINSLLDSDLVIAEVTPPNPNVFYELGYAHALAKPTVLLARRGGELPFDISGYRVILYDDTIGGKPQVEKTLDRHLANIKRAGAYSGTAT
ncbi:MAG: hypothetical protein OXH96_15195 [Spirochaetaceae bacterium]|nr:hypothetical protein [Spirochaetaceae bacterium]